MEATVDGSTMTPEKMEPSTIFIPAIGAYSKVEETNEFDRRRSLRLPNDANILAHWTPSAGLGAADGNTLIAGHITYNNEKGALLNMGTMQAGDRAYTKDANGNVTEFVLVGLKLVVKKDLPASIWQVDGDRKLTVVTCGGPAEHTSHGRQYRDNLIGTFLPVAH